MVCGAARSRDGQAAKVNRDSRVQIKHCLSIADPDAATNAADKPAKVRVAQTIFNEVRARVYKLRQRAR
jgi:hypothetical protein